MLQETNRHAIGLKSTRIDLKSQYKERAELCFRGVPPEACGGTAPACRIACLQTGRHFGVQVRALARGAPPRFQVAVFLAVQFPYASSLCKVNIEV
jgi:hypothetical protein